jgi:hypothetical protein
MKSGPGDALLGPVLGDGLRNGHDVVFGEAAIQGGATMAGGAEGDLLTGVRHIGPRLVVEADELGDVRQFLLGDGLSCIRM